MWKIPEVRLNPILIPQVYFLDIYHVSRLYFRRYWDTTIRTRCKLCPQGYLNPEGYVKRNIEKLGYTHTFLLCIEVTTRNMLKTTHIGREKEEETEGPN